MEVVRTSNEAAGFDRRASGGSVSPGAARETGAAEGATCDDPDEMTVNGAGDRSSSTDDGKNPSSEENGLPENDGPVKSGGGDDLRRRSGSQSRARKRRRKRKAGEHRKEDKKWKLYEDMSWDEKRKHEERETERANRRREERFASGQPMAPYNTTQFLMEQHEPASPTAVHHRADHSGLELRLSDGGDRRFSGDGSYTGDSSSDQDEMDEAEYLEKDFAEAYESFHAERIQAMTKSDLVREYLDMEAKLETMQRRAGQGGTGGDIDSPSRPVPVPELLAEVERLRGENERLVRENQELKAKASADQVTVHQVAPASNS